MSERGRSGPQRKHRGTHRLKEGEMDAEQRELQVPTISTVTYSFNKHLSPSCEPDPVPHTEDMLKDRTDPSLTSWSLWSREGSRV